ncbi:LytR/AlgR family response regulator transcription factor [Mucilaginibacter sp. AW1-7]|jgi:DNA-binding LytR/AlgR family response regulator|uniref:LytR/AlgR family response regulator transcription factor n=1 Tax=unclassified Mucilaginibacter TaxID=2617802 RepID=UPI0008BCB7A1|nr:MULTISPECIES: LytTR family DNA-binding domain-containing protein [unclassified Mucilaginibacter]WDF79388.1 LytTR family DNA-binding domain-containing protein [Mucilaginibacter sp. KACC 22773]SEP22374.1 two component transcriptional regulator, LytTR family [Mucilaginibacter sp. OK283]
MKLRILIVDDEPYAIEVMENYLRNFDDMEIVGKCSNAIQAFQLLQQKTVDLMFLDIQMPGITGIDFLKTLKNPPKTIFTTAYSQYALDGFELNVVDYLVKPIPLDRFMRAIDKVYQLNGNKASAGDNYEKNVGDTEAFLYLKVERKTIKINVNDILWVESLRDYVKVITTGNAYISKQKISLLEGMLPENKFVRAHRSFIIAIAHISSFYAYSVEVNGHELPIGRNYKQEMQKRLKADNFHFR